MSAAEQVALLAELIAPIAVEHVVDPARVRAHEVMDLRGDPTRLRAATGWEPEIPFRQTMADTIDVVGARARSCALGHAVSAQPAHRFRTRRPISRSGG